MITTDRMILRPWRETDLEGFSAMHADPEVMVDMPPITIRAQSEAKFRRYRDAFERLGFCRWAVEDRNGGFIGYVGIMPISDAHPAAPGVEIGWRLVRQAWGKGYASEGGRAALKDGFDRIGFTQVLSYTAPENLRSQAVMRRLGLDRDAARDFVANTPEGIWVGWVWVARAETWDKTVR
jgi:RimJ/RimL family protein N-acetyltransferase